MRGRFKAQAGAGIQPELALLKDAVAVERFGAVEEHFPLHRQKWNVKCVEEGQGHQPAIDVEIDEHEVGAHGTAAVAAMIRSRMSAQWIAGLGIQPKHEVVLHGKLAS